MKPYSEVRLVSLVGFLSLMLTFMSATPAQTQTITSYNFVVYDQGASQPVQQNAITSWTCAQAPPPANASNVNPTRIVWQDPADANFVCVADQTQFLLSIPLGQSGSRLLDGVLFALGPGGTSPGSNRAPFERRAEAPVAPVGLRVVR